MNLHDCLKALLFPVTSIDTITLMKKLKELPVPFCLMLFGKKLKDHSAGGFDMASGKTKNVS